MIPPGGGCGGGCGDDSRLALCMELLQQRRRIFSCRKVSSLMFSQPAGRTENVFLRFCLTAASYLTAAFLHVAGTSRGWPCFPPRGAFIGQWADGKNAKAPADQLGFVFLLFGLPAALPRSLVQALGMMFHVETSFLHHVLVDTSTGV